MKKLLFIALTGLIISSCGNTGNKEVQTKAEGIQASNKIEFTALIENPGEYIGKTISVKGKVVHVCTHSGKKLFITGENQDIRLYVQAGEEMPKFSMELLGSEIIVQGTLVQSVAASMEGGEGMHSGEGMNPDNIEVVKAASDSCETEIAMAAQPVLSDLMMVYDKHSLVK